MWCGKSLIRALHTNPVRGPIPLQTSLENYHKTMGIQSYFVDQACEILEKMRMDNTKILLTCTTSVMMSGLREIIKQLVQQQKVHGLVLSAGALEQDLIQCLSPTRLGDFTVENRKRLSDVYLRQGNMVFSQKALQDFYEIVNTSIEKLLQRNQQITQDSLLQEITQIINQDESVIDQSYKTNIPIICPDLMNGELGNGIYLSSLLNNNITVSNTQAQQNFLDQIQMGNVGLLCLGAGISQNYALHLCRIANGAKSAVFINTSHAFDGGSAGQDTQYFKKQGYLDNNASAVKITSECTLVLPIIAHKVFH